MREFKSLTQQEAEGMAQVPHPRLVRRSFGMASHEAAWQALLAFDEAMRKPETTTPSAALLSALCHPLAPAAQGVARQAVPVIERFLRTDAMDDLASHNAWRCLDTIQAMGFSKGQGQALMSQEFIAQTLGMIVFWSGDLNGRAPKDMLGSLMELSGRSALDAFGQGLRLELALGTIASLHFKKGVAERFELDGQSNMECMGMGVDDSDDGVSAGLALWMRRALHRLSFYQCLDGEADPLLLRRAELLGVLAREVVATQASAQSRQVAEALDAAGGSLALIERLALGKFARAAPGKRQPSL